MKRTWSIVLAALMIVLLLLPLGCGKGESKEAYCKTVTVNGETFEDQSWKYIVLSDGTAKLTGYIDMGVRSNLPEKVDGHPVSAIGKDTFRMNGEFRTVDDEIVIPNCIKTIEGNPFDYDILNSSRSFYVSASHPTLEFVDGMLFEKNPRRLICASRDASSEVLIPEGTEIIEDHAFRSVVIGLVNIPASVKQIGKNPFAYRMVSSIAHEFSEITVDPANPYFEIRDGLLYEKKADRIICVSRYDFAARLNENGGKFAVPEGTEAIDDQAFLFFYNFELSIPASVKEIGSSPVSSSANVVVSPDNPVFEVVDNVLYDKKQKRVVQAVNKDMLKGTVSIRQGTEIIGEYAFNACWAETIVIPDSVKEIEAYAFSSCIGTVQIPSGVKKIGTCAFYGCQFASEPLILDGRPEIAPSGLRGNGYENETDVSEIRFTDGAILHSAALYNRGVTRVTVQGESRIATKAFLFCGRLEDVELSEGVIAIAGDAFSCCPYIEELRLPKSLKWISSDFINSSQEIYTQVGSRDTYVMEYICTMTFAVCHGTYAEQYVKEKGLEYRYVD